MKLKKLLMILFFVLFGFYQSKEIHFTEWNENHSNWIWHSSRCGKVVNLSPDNVLVKPILVTKYNGEIIEEIEGVIGFGNFTDYFCYMDSFFDDVSPGQQFFFEVNSGTILVENPNLIDSYIRFESTIVESEQIPAN